MIDTMYRYAKFQYECGNYSGAAEYLYFVRVLVSTFTLILPLGTHVGISFNVLLKLESSEPFTLLISSFRCLPVIKMPSLLSGANLHRKY